MYGKYLQLKNEDGWQDGWKVVKVYKSTRCSEKELDDLEIQYKKTRKVSDI